MFSKNMMLFVATTVVLAAGPAAGQEASLHHRLTARAEIAKLDRLSDENVRIEGRALASTMLTGCVAKKDVPEGETLEARDLLCAGGVEKPALPQERVREL